jgi:hypothetical protein
LRSPVAAQARLRAGDRRDHAGTVNAPDQRVIGVGDEDLAVASDRNVLRAVERRRGGRSPVAAGGRRPGAGDRRDHALSIDASNAMVVGIGDEQTPVGVEGDPVRREELGARGLAAVAGEAALARTGDHRETSAGQLHYLMGAVVGNVECAVGVEREAGGMTRRGARGMPCPAG